MSGGPVVVQRSLAMAAAADRVWSLLVSPRAWSSWPGHFAFDAGVPPETRLRIVLGVTGRQPACAAYVIRDEVPGQVISLSSPGSLPPGGQVLTLSALPDGDGARVGITVRHAVPKGASRRAARAYWQRELAAWLASLREVAEDRQPRPGPGMPAGLQAACTPRAQLRRPGRASASALITAPVSQVWEAIWAPESALTAGHGHVCAAPVPGTPARRAGEMQYFVHRRGDGQFDVNVIVVTELTTGRSVLVARVVPPRAEALHLLTPQAGGTLFELTLRWPPGTARRHQQIVQQRMADKARAWVGAFKNLIENPTSAPS